VSNTGIGDPVLRGLRQVRGLLVVVQGGMALWALALGEHEHQPYGLLAVCGALMLAELVPTKPVARAVTDFAALAVLQGLWGPHYPLQPLALVELVLVATVAGPRAAWGLTVLAVGLPALDAWLQARLLGEDALHLVSHVASAAVAAVSLGWFSQQLGAALERQARGRREAEAERERAARLAVVGTMAAGMAHELATPLGSIELLAEEASEELSEGPGREALGTLQQQVRRCRGILDRVLSRGEPEHRQCAIGGVLEEAAQAWRQAHPDVALVVEGTAVPVVRGDDGTWSAALWTLLDNAERAGGPVTVRWREEEGVVVEVDDGGVGPDEATCERAGEPFFTGWKGTGLGLYAVRQGLEAVGGRYALRRRDGGGGRATLWIPTVTEAS